MWLGFQPTITPTQLTEDAHMKVLYAYVLLALAFVLTASPAISQAQESESFVAKVAVSDEAVTFHMG